MTVESLEVRDTSFKRMPKYVVQDKMTVRVFRHSPDRVEMQIRHPKHYAHTTLTPSEARKIATMLVAAADEAES